VPEISLPLLPVKFLKTMAKRKQFKMDISERRRRHFSDSFKAKKAKPIEPVFYGG